MNIYSKIRGLEIEVNNDELDRHKAFKHGYPKQLLLDLDSNISGKRKELQELQKSSLTLQCTTNPI